MHSRRVRPPSYYSSRHAQSAGVFFCVVGRVRMTSSHRANSGTCAVGVGTCARHSGRQCGRTLGPLVLPPSSRKQLKQFWRVLGLEGELYLRRHWRYARRPPFWFGCQDIPPCGHHIYARYDKEKDLSLISWGLIFCFWFYLLSDV